MDGVIIVNKEPKWTSHDVCFKLKKILGVKKTGHTGTLDPMAEGILEVLTGNAVRLSEYIVNDAKEYIADVRFGITTDTDDIWGNVVKSCKPCFSERRLNEALNEFKGEIMQLPPAYSAVKINGRRMYDYAHKGEIVIPSARKIEIFNLELISFSNPDSAKLKIECSKGTYIRSLCRDLGNLLGCGAVMSSLVRTRVGCVDINKAYTVAQIQEAVNNNTLNDVILKPDYLLLYMKRIDVRRESLRILEGGNLLLPQNIEKAQDGIKEGEIVRIYYMGSFYAVGIAAEGGIKPKKVFGHLTV